MTIERDFDIGFVANLALREKQIQQNYRPIISVHKWFARRPGTLFRGLLLSEFGAGPLDKIFFRANKLRGLRIADPFMGGGTPLIEANRLGCDVIGYDINPMAYWIVRQEIEHLDLGAYREAATRLIGHLRREIGALYQTRCSGCGLSDAQVKYFLWVKYQTCIHCKKDIDLFPGYLLAENRRHPKNVLICPSCHDLNEVHDRQTPGSCGSCGSPLSLSGPARRNRVVCSHCDNINSYPDTISGAPRHRMFAIEYHCSRCKPYHEGRFFKKPDEQDLAYYDEASQRWQTLDTQFVPEDEIPKGDETDRLHRWGYMRYKEMFNPRQLLGLELSCRAIFHEVDERLRHALATNLSDLLRYQNMLCRYDTMALKSLDIFSVHGYPVGLIQAESNFIGISKEHGGNIGSGGWTNITDKYLKGKAYCDSPFEIRYVGNRKTRVPISGEWIGDRRDGTDGTEKRCVELYCKSSTEVDLPSDSLDGVFTDPPYFGNVQYAELMDFCYVWLRRLVHLDNDVFAQKSTRNSQELTGNLTLDRGLNDFVDGLSEVFRRMTSAMKPGAPLVFTYHHNRLESYLAVGVGILDTGFTCSASLPCPAEMSASIHIRGTRSSIIDTIFVCRSTGSVPRRWIVDTPQALAALVEDDLRQLRAAGVGPTQGDIRCIIYGHLTRLAIWKLRKTWDRERPVSDRMEKIAEEIERLGGPPAVEKCLETVLSRASSRRGYSLREEAAMFEYDDEIPF